MFVIIEIDGFKGKEKRGRYLFLKYPKIKNPLIASLNTASNDIMCEKNLPPSQPVRFPLLPKE